MPRASAKLGFDCGDLVWKENAFHRFTQLFQHHRIVLASVSVPAKILSGQHDEPRNRKRGVATLNLPNNERNIPVTHGFRAWTTAIVPRLSQNVIVFRSQHRMCLRGPERVTSGDLAAFGVWTSAKCCPPTSHSRAFSLWGKLQGFRRAHVRVACLFATWGVAANVPP